jgi:hypothetical protein
MDIDAFHLPGVTADTHVVAEQDGVRAVAPDLDPAALGQLCDRLIDAARRLKQLPVARIIAAIDAAARRLRDESSPVRDDVLRGLAAFTGYSPDMTRAVLDRMSEDWLAPALHRLVDAELGGADAIEGFVDRADGVRSRAVAPALGFHVFAGNVPGVSVTSIVRALIVRSAVFGKSARDEPVLAPAFARLLAAVDPEVGACVAVTCWEGGDVAREAAVLSRARLVVHYGGADAIASLRARADDGTLFIEHGPRLSFMLLDADAAHDATTARDAADAVAMFDQQGCVSPQIAWVVGSATDARAFAAATADALRSRADSLPRGRISAAEAAAVREARTRAEFRAIAGDDVLLWEGDDLAWTVILDPDSSFSGSRLNRTLIVRRAASVHDVIDLAAPHARYLQSVGVAGFEHDTLTIAAALAEIGVTRVTPISAMPWPPVTWHHDGRGPLRELVRWVDVEA